jgi:hypothetical protein
VEEVGRAKELEGSSGRLRNKSKKWSKEKNRGKVRKERRRFFMAKEGR